MSYHAVDKAALPFGLCILGGHHPDDMAEIQTLLLLGPTSDFWEIFSASPEALDKAPDPIDRWSARVILRLAQSLNATPYLPFGGPPYAPFLSWALTSGRSWSSPVGMLIHDTNGLMISFRGALGFSTRLTLPSPPLYSPCDTCKTKPCQTACPVNALGPAGYNTQACHAHLDTAAGAACLNSGCATRRICPISPKRSDAQSAHHMRYFHR